MGEILGTIHLETKFLSSFEPVKLDRLSAYKIQWWDTHRIGIPIPKGGNWETENGAVSPEGQKPSNAYSTRP